mgnify:CR=1 FL=1
MEAKIVFITGASSGIGEGCARKFAKEGWNLILNARTVSKLEELKAELEKMYGVRVYIHFLLMYVTGSRLLQLWNLCPKSGKRLMCWSTMPDW